MIVRPAPLSSFAPNTAPDGMNSNPKPYPSMKDSGVKWIGCVPEHWNVQRIRTVARILSGATPRSDVPSYWDGDITWITPEDLGAITSPYIHTSARKITYDGFQSCGTRFAPKSSIAISTRAPIGHIGILTSPACVNQGCRLLVSSVHSTFLYFVLKAARLEIRSHGSGTTFTELSRRKLADFCMPVPPAAEQSHIGLILDHVVRRIQRYIYLKERLVALLEEHKRAIIHQAVTGQIDVRTGSPYVAYRPSHIGFLREVPAHWDVQRLKQIATVNPGWSRNTDALAPDDRVTFLPMERVGSDGSIDTREVLTASAVGYGFTTFRRGDILVAKITPCFENGKGADLQSMPTRFGFGSTEFHVLRARSPVTRRFLYHVTTASDFRDRGANSMIGAAGQQRVPSTFIANYPVFLPPLPEQVKIVSFLDRFNGGIDRAIASASRQLTLAQELSVRLIADAVTGKIDLRHEVLSSSAMPALRSVEAINAVD